MNTSNLIRICVRLCFSTSRFITKFYSKLTYRRWRRELIRIAGVLGQLLLLLTPPPPTQQQQQTTRLLCILFSQIRYKNNKRTNMATRYVQKKRSNTKKWRIFCYDRCATLRDCKCHAVYYCMLLLRRSCRRLTTMYECLPLLTPNC